MAYAGLVGTVCRVNWWTFAVTAGAVIRLTRLITHDTITARLRIAAARYDARNRLAMRKPPAPGPGPVLGFLTCPWCISVYVSAALFALYGAAPGHCRPYLALAYAALTASWAAGTALTNGSHHPATPAPPAPPKPPAAPAPVPPAPSPAPSLPHHDAVPVEPPASSIPAEVTS